MTTKSPREKALEALAPFERVHKEQSNRPPDDEESVGCLFTLKEIGLAAEAYEALRGEVDGRTFENWANEMEAFGFRFERACKDVRGDERQLRKWLEAAFNEGRKSVPQPDQRSEGR